MNRSQLEHVLRAASKIAQDPDVLVLGSQSILGTFDESQLPDPAQASIEADITFFDDWHNDKSDLVDGALGEDSQFHRTFGFYAQGVNVEVAVLPDGWRDRLVLFRSANTDGATGHCLEPHDLVVAKLAAAREKDHEFAGALLAEGLVRADLLVERARTLSPPATARRVADWVHGWTRKHGQIDS